MSKLVEDQYVSKPFMQEEEIQLIKDSILQIANTKDKISCFEWGSGGSTEYFVDFLSNEGFSFEWHSAEHNPEWAKKVDDKIINKKFHMHAFDYGGYTRAETRKLCMKEYVDMPLAIDGKFDIMIVDGRKRSRCMNVAREKISAEGVVFLHDCDREHYHSAIENFSNKLIVKRLLMAGVKA